LKKYVLKIMFGVKMLSLTKKVMMHLSDQLGILSIIGSGFAGAGIATLLIEGTGVASLEFLAALIGLGLIILDYFVVFPSEEEEI